MQDKSLIDILWVVISAALVFMMQPGFLCLESGLTRSKNAINVAMKNLTDFGVAVLVYWMFGFAWMFGITQGGWIGTTLFFSPDGQGPWLAAFFLFQVMFCATAATIVSGAVAERLKFGAYIIATFIISGLIYPLFGHWVWGGAFEGGPGWLASRGFIDFAGSTVVHSVGGWVGLAILLIIGPRMGRFPQGECPRKIPGSNLPVAMLGVLLLYFGWFGFNAGSTLAMDEQVPKILVNTALAGASGLVATLAFGWIWKRVPELIFPMNGALAGLVAITANCHAVDAPSAVLIGAVGGLVMLGADVLLERFRIDDAVGAVPVHLAAGIWGTLAVALFGDLQILGTGLTRVEQLKVQVLGIGVCFVFAFGVAYLLLRLINIIFPLRIRPEDETKGLNVVEHGATTEILDLLTVMEQQARTQNLELKVPVEPFTEVGQIARQYNRVMDSLREAMGRIKAIIENALDSIIEMDGRGFVTMWTPKAVEMFGWSSEEALGKKLGDLIIPPKYRAAHEKELEHLCATGEGPVLNKRLELTALRRSGEEFPVELSVAQVRKGKDPAFSAFLRDITERKRADQELKEMKEAAEQAKDRAESANLAKSQFLAQMSHELRTPLNGVLGYTQILKRRKDIGSKTLDGLNIIENSGIHLLTLINDILDLAKIEAGKLELEPSQFDFQRFLETVNGIISMRAREKKLKYVYEPGDHLPVGIEADEKRLRQVLLNLLGNAVKFTDQGEVTFRVSLNSEQKKTKRTVHFEIDDTGPGMSKEQVEKIFQPFEQVSGAEHRSEGTGLGLAITHQLVSLMASQIKVKSKLGEGSRFWFDVEFPVIDLAMTETLAQEEEIIGYEGERKNALVVDDNTENRLVLVDMLEMLGFKVIIAKDGAEAIDEADKHQPHIIFMDLRMPKVSGLEAAEEIRKHEAIKDVFIIAISASVSKENQELSQLKGCDSFIAKPVQMKELLDTLEKYLKLKWIFEKREETSVDSSTSEMTEEDLVVPSLEEIETLYALSLEGNMRKIRDWSKQLAAKEKKYTRFANKLQALAKGFHEKAILNLVKQYRK